MYIHVREREPQLGPPLASERGPVLVAREGPRNIADYTRYIFQNYTINENTINAYGLEFILNNTSNEYDLQSVYNGNSYIGIIT